MKYSLTDKLDFNSNPVIEIKDKKISVNASAETVLKLLDILENQGETKVALLAGDLLFSDKDKKIIKDLKLSFSDYTTLIATSISLALGEDPDEEEETSKGEE